MSSAQLKSPPSDEPQFDLEYSVEDFGVGPHRDSQYLIERMEETLLAEARTLGGRVLDVACGVGALTARLNASTGAAYGLDPSSEMLGIGVLLDPDRRRLFVRGLAEALPFRQAAFDAIVCEGALDHFVDPGRFMREAARLLKPDGRLVIALANYESLSCRIGRFMARWSPHPRSERPYWQPPPDHHHMGSVEFARRLRADTLKLERIGGVSMLWLLPGWGRLLDRLPSAAANAALRACDAIAHRLPASADVLVSVWRKEMA